MRVRALTLALVMLALAPAVRADLIELTDGRKFNGSLVRSGDVVTIKSDDGKVVNIKPGDIAKVTLVSTVTPEEAAAQEWSRVGTKVKSTDDLQAVIDLYKKYADKYPDAKQAGEARSTAAVYETMLKNDPVKFRGKWMPRVQVDVVRKQWKESARPALDLYKAGRMKEALESAKAILADDDQNPDALALGGLAAYRSANMAQAKTYFTSLAAADPGSLLAENNLAVIAVGQKALGEAFGHYGKALQIMPDHRLLLDNIAEAINIYLAGGGEKTGMAYRTLVKAFEPAETRLEETMLKQGQVRWGATWVTREQQERLVKVQDAMRDQWGRLDAQYTAARNTLNGLSAQIRQSGADLDNLADTINTCTARVLASQGFAVDVSFYLAQREVASQNYQRVLAYRNQLQMQYDQLAAGTKDFLAQAEKLKGAFSAGGIGGQYTGAQRIVDLGETEVPPAPASVPEPTSITIPQLPMILINPPPPPAAPVLVPIPTGTPVLVPVAPRAQGPATGPGTQPKTGPATQPKA
jgi:tetratricopeptide (TPR) repeat protein